MARSPRNADDAIARFDEYSARLDGHTPAARSARRRDLGRSARSVGKRLTGAAIAIVSLFLLAASFGLFVAPIGWTGLLILGLAIVAVLVFFAVRPGEPERVAYSEDLPTAAVVRQLDSLLVRERAALPAPAARRVDAISASLPLLESRLEEVDALDPLAQDARRLMGKHLPELIERYERVPAQHRHQRDGEGLTVDERLVASLDAAREALDDLGTRLSESDRRAFETQGRFIESRYKDGTGPAEQ